MSQPDWALAILATIDAALPLRATVLHDSNGQLAAVAPLVVSGRGLSRRLMPAGVRTYEPPAFAARDSAALAELLEAIGRQGLPLMLPAVYAHSAEAEAFAGHPAGGIRPRGRASPATARKSLDIDELDASIGGQRRSIVRRKRKAAEKLGTLEVSFFSPSAGEVEAALDELVVVEAAGWKGRAGTSLRHDLPLQAFYRAYAGRAASRGLVRFGRITIAGRLAAMRMDVEWGGERWELKIGFDEHFADVSPGQLLSYETFKDARARGARFHNFLGGYEGWQDDWGIEVLPQLNLRRYPLTPSGLAALGADGASAALRKIVSRRRSR